MAGALRKSPRRADLETAFAPFEAALILDGLGNRFFQDSEELQGATTPVSALFMDSPAEHFVKPGRTTVFSRVGAAIALATLQTSSPSGGAGHRTSLRGGGPLTTLAIPGTLRGRESMLWERLWANVPEDLKVEDGEPLSRVFPWLGPTRTSDPKSGGVATTPEDVHPAQAFFGMPRRIRLAFEPNTAGRACDLTGLVDDVIVTGYVTRPWGTDYTGWSKEHPLSPYYKQKPSDTEYLPLHLKSARVGYRDWLGMTVDVNSTDGSGSKRNSVPAACVAEFRTRAADLDAAARRGARLLVAGYAMDNMKPLDFGEAMLPLIVSRDENTNEAIKDLARRWVNAADLVANQLVTAARRALFGEKGKAERDSTVLEPVKARFWADTEQDFFAKLQAAADDYETKLAADRDLLASLNTAVGLSWLKSLTRHALAIFDDTVPIDDAKSDKIEDMIEGRKMLVFALTGYGPVGGPLFGMLGQPPRETKRKGRKAA
ncbi:MAG TPA: type I-E CRISPR-associated protein Cse1/CasA [Hyphomicrobium sp.]|nr:type I-E CRISPR-associated protein Cse1/CasA [Hyphomicrobium sp.]